MVQKRYRKRRRWNWLCAICIVLVLAALFGAARARLPVLSDITRNFGFGRAEGTVDLRHLYSGNAILVDKDTGEVLAEHKGQRKIYPASMTKIMTALLAVEHTENWEENVTLPYEIFLPLYEENASMAGFQPGETANLKDLLYGALLPSGAECCLTFAVRIAGSESAFVDLMNEKAAALGMEDTHFCNATGLQSKEHYSTAADMVLLLREALKYDAFREAFTAKSHSTRPSEAHPEGFTFYSTLFQYMDSASVPGGEILGGKTGYTEEAGLCLASLARVNGKEYILVTAGAEGSHETAQFHILDAIDVYGQLGKREG